MIINQIDKGDDASNRRLIYEWLGRFTAAQDHLTKARASLAELQQIESDLETKGKEIDPDFKGARLKNVLVEIAAAYEAVTPESNDE